MPHRPLQFGPDPNRTYLERWNEMRPDRCGRPDCSVNSGHDWQEMHDTDAGGDSQNFLDSLLSLAIIVLEPLAGATATFLIYRWTTPSQLTTDLTRLCGDLSSHRMGRRHAGLCTTKATTGSDRRW